MPEPTPAPRTPDAACPDGRRRSRRTLLLLAVVCVAPVVASYVAYYLLPHDAQANYGALLPTAPAPALEGTGIDGTPFALAGLRGRWIVLQTGDAGCDAGCERMLYATRQARTMQGREQERIIRVLLVADGAMPAAAVLPQHPGLVIARVATGAQAMLPGTVPAIYVIDPLGNLVLRYSVDPDIKGIAKDLGRLLKASRIG